MTDFFHSKNHDRLNGKPFDPERITGRLMLNPVRPAYTILPDTEVIFDSGAFQELGSKTRVTPEQALRRQIIFIRKIRERNNMPRWYPNVLTIYDQMRGVDEAVVNGVKIKIRGDKNSGSVAVTETLRAAKVYHENRHFFKTPIMFIGQGINPDQYINDCVKPMLPMVKDGDWFGLGGFCIIGKVPSLKPLFRETVDRILPLIAECGIKRLHVLGVCVADCIEYASKAVKSFDIKLSNDSASPETNGAMFGKKFIDQKWQPFYAVSQKYTDYHPCDLALENIETYSNWCQEQ